ncbi:hypothetical protein D3C78_1559380 [compost metagenome]
MQGELPELAIGNGAATVAMFEEVGADRRVAVDGEEFASGACGAAAVAENNDMRLQDFDLSIEQALGVMLDRFEVWMLLGVALLPGKTEQIGVNESTLAAFLGDASGEVMECPAFGVFLLELPLEEVPMRRGG